MQLKSGQGAHLGFIQKVYKTDPDTSLRCGCLGEAVWFNQQDALLRQETPLKYSSRRPDSSSKAELGTVLPNWTEGDRETWNELVVDAAEHDDVIQGFL